MAESMLANPLSYINLQYVEEHSNNEYISLNSSRENGPILASNRVMLGKDVVGHTEFDYYKVEECEGGSIVTNVQQVNLSGILFTDMFNGYLRNPTEVIQDMKNLLY